MEWLDGQSLKEAWSPKPVVRSGMRRTTTTLMVATTLLGIVGAGMARGIGVRATRFPENPLITLTSSSSLGDNANGPSIIRVPGWVAHPLGRYYMYFAHH